MASKSITSFLKSPRAVAHACDWGKNMGKTILNLSIADNQIQLTVASHPELDEPLHPLPSIPLRHTVVDNRKTLQPIVGEELATVLNTFNVCGMVVDWPVQSQGWVGKQAGKVLHTLDELSVHHDIVNKPICLWDEEHCSLQEDEWGRSATDSQQPAANTTTNHHHQHHNIHVASQDQYRDPACSAAEMWSDFCQENFPEANLEPPVAHLGRGAGTNVSLTRSSSSSSTPVAVQGLPFEQTQTQRVEAATV